MNNLINKKEINLQKIKEILHRVLQISINYKTTHTQSSFSLK